MPKPISHHIKTHHTAIIVLLGLVIALGVVLFYSWPKYKMVQENEETMQEINGQISIAKSELDRLVELNKNPQPTQREKLLKEQLPEDPMVSELIRYFEDITPYTTVPDYKKKYLKSFSVKPASMSKKEQAMSAYQKYEVQLNIESSHAAFLELLRELERDDKRLFSIKQINLKKETDPKANIEEQNKYTISLVTYNQKPKALQNKQ